MQIIENVIFYIKKFIILFRLIILFCTILIYSFALWKFYIIHHDQYVVVMHTDRFEWSQFVDTLSLLNTFTLRYLTMTPWYIHVLFGVLFVGLCLLDYVIGSLFGICYISICLLLGCHYDITNLMSFGTMYYVDLPYIQIEFLYNESVLQSEALRYLSELNSEWETNYKLDPILVSEWVKTCGGRKSILMVELALHFTLRHLLNNFSLANSRRKKKQKESNSSSVSWYGWLIQQFTGGRK